MMRQREQLREPIVGPPEPVGAVGPRGLRGDRGERGDSVLKDPEQEQLLPHESHIRSPE
jgi:hypothetical protein